MTSERAPSSSVGSRSASMIHGGALASRVAVFANGSSGKRGRKTSDGPARARANAVGGGAGWRARLLDATGDTAGGVCMVDVACGRRRRRWRAAATGAERFEERDVGATKYVTLRRPPCKPGTLPAADRFLLAQPNDGFSHLHSALAPSRRLRIQYKMCRLGTRSGGHGTWSNTAITS
jgi:hypothetical protein